MHKHSKSRHSVLLVEDEAPLREALAKLLRSEGFSVHQAADGEEGLAQAKKFHPDAILLDIAMPRMDGMTMLQHVREEGDWGRHVMIVVLTNLSADDKILRGIVTHEPAFYLVKSDWHAGEVIHKVKECLEGSKR